MHIEAHQYLDLVAMFAGNQMECRLSDRAIHQKLCARHLSDRRVKNRAVHIDLPENIAAMAAGKPHKDKLNKTYAAFQSITEAAAISQASNPLIMVEMGLSEPMRGELIPAGISQ